MTSIHRRRWLQAAGMGLCGASMSGWLPAIADQLANDPKRRRHCILLWMSGGPSQTDTFDMKPNHENGGEFKEVATNVPGVRFSEHLPALAKHADKMAIVRSLTTKEGDHGRGTHLMTTGQPPMGAIDYPTIGAALAKELGSIEDELPNYISIAPYRGLANDAVGPGFLGPRHSPLFVNAVGAGNRQPSPAANASANNAPATFANLTIDGLKLPAHVSNKRLGKRMDLWRTLETGFSSKHPAAAPRSHRTIYENAVRLMNSESAKAFDLSDEPDELRSAYGTGSFGQGCLMARRLVERGASFVEVTLSSNNAGLFGWDTHTNNFEAVKGLSAELDAGWGTLMTDLEQRGLLESTTILWMGEFGRTPQINAGAGRDHFPQAWTCAFAGGGIAGGQAYGSTTEDGTHVAEDPTTVHEVLATLCAALGVDPATQNIANTGRPISIVEGSPIKSILS